jgi:hypothetical protein
VAIGQRYRRSTESINDKVNVSERKSPGRAALSRDEKLLVGRGSQRSRIVRLILMSGLKLAAIGCVLGLAGAAGASNVLRSFLFQVSPFDPMVMILTAIAIFCPGSCVFYFSRAPCRLG